MDIRVLRYFLIIAEMHTMSKAANFLHISQSNLSKQISNLEADLGVKLFNRDYHEMTLTEEGRYLQSRAKEIVRLVDKTQSTLQNNDSLINGELDIGAGESNGMKRILQIVSAIQKDHPDVKIHLHSGDADEIENKLVSGTLDFGVIMGERRLTQYNSLRLPDIDRWGIILPIDDPLVKKQTLTPEDLIDRPVILSEQAYQQQRFEDWWRNESDNINIIGTYNLLFNAAIMVQNHSCLALAFENLISVEQNSQLTFRPLAPEQIEPTTLIWQKNNSLSSVANLFLNKLKASL